jgi:predicted DNA-binding antitoxin AbrB/MazE fold protein
LRVLAAINLSLEKKVMSKKLIEVVYEGGVFKPIRKADLKEGIKGVVLLRSEGIADILEKYSRKVERDVLQEFLAERR